MSKKLNFKCVEELKHIGIELLEPFRGVNHPHKMKCLNCGHIWNKHPASTHQSFKNKQTNGCPKCSANKTSIRKTDNEYPDKLKEIGIELLEPYKGSNIHHKMKCITCTHTWTATPKSKINNFKKYREGGCPKCTFENRYQEGREEAIQKIKNRGFIILSDYDGQYSKTNKIKVKNEICGHIFESMPHNLLVRDVICPVCNKEEKTKRLNKHMIRVHEEYLKTATDWQAYKSVVFKLSRLSYKNNKSIINPNNLPQGKAGIVGAHHIDHIVPIRYCFNHNIPSEICSHYSNLQMLEWTANIGSRDKLKSYIPSIFETYIKS